MSDEKSEFFIEYYSRYFRQLKLYAYSVLRNWGRAEEVTQEVFLIAWRRIDAFMDSPNPVGWLTNVSKFTLKNVAKSDSVRARYWIALPDFMDVEQLAQYNPAEEAAHDLQDECASLLSVEEYHILRRAVLDKAAYQEIAEELGITVWACQKRMQRLLKKLRDHLQE